MSDDLDRAVDARIDAHTPSVVPPFEAITARRRARDRRRGGVALLGTALAVAATALAPSLLTQNITRPAQVAAADATYHTFHLRYADANAFRRDERAVQECLTDPSVVRSATLRSMPPQLTGLVRGESAAERLVDCLDENAFGASVETARAHQQPTAADVGPYALTPDGRTLTVTAAVGGGCEETGTATATAEETAERVVVTALVARPPAAVDERGSGPVCPADLVTQEVQVRLRAPLGDRDVIDASTGKRIAGPSRPSEDRVYSVRAAVRAVPDRRWDEQRDACFSLPGVRAVSVQESNPATYEVTVPAMEAEAFERCVEDVVGLSVSGAQEKTPPAVAWTGAQVCVVGTGEECRRLGAEQAQALDAVLSRARPAPATTAYCKAHGTVYRIAWEHPSVRPTPVEVPSICAPMRRGDRDFLLDQAGRDAVRSAFEAGSPVPEPGTDRASQPLTATQRAFVQSCVGRERALPAPGWVGRSEAELLALEPADPAPRLVGRDGACLGRRQDRRSDRVNLILEDGTVIWAGRF